MLAIGLLVPVLATIALLCQSRANALHDRWPAEADTFYLPPSRILRIASLGHSELAADLIHSRANVYYGTQLHARLPTKWLAGYLNRAIDLDPQFRRLYLAGAAMLIYGGQRIVPDMVLAANVVLERGRQAFPFDWEIPFQLGFNLLYELPNDASPDDPRIPGWRQQGVEILRQAALFEGVPYFIPNLVARMLTTRGSQDLAVRHLEQAYAVATSEAARTQIREKLAQLRGADWQYYKGGDGMKDSAWANEMPRAKVIVASPGKLSMTGAAYVPGLGRYMMIEWYYPGGLVARGATTRTV